MNGPPAAQDEPAAAADGAAAATAFAARQPVANGAAVEAQSP
jgi:hypothetical protein